MSDKNIALKNSSGFRPLLDLTYIGQFSPFSAQLPSPKLQELFTNHACPFYVFHLFRNTRYKHSLGPTLERWLIFGIILLEANVSVSLQKNRDIRIITESFS